MFDIDNVKVDSCYCQNMSPKLAFAFITPMEARVLVFESFAFSEAM